MEESVGKRIRKVRQLLKLSQASFGEGIGYKSAAIGHFEKGIRKATERALKLISDVYRVRLDWLKYGGDDDSIFSESLQIPENVQALGDFAQTFYTAYAKLTPAQRKIADVWIRKLLGLSDGEKIYEDRNSKPE